jgi:UDP-N-acetylmuramate dehydrogenase
MPVIEETVTRLAEISTLQVSEGAPLSSYTRFGIGGPADIFAEAGNASAFVEALRVARASGLDYSVIGSGTNLIVSDAGYRGLVLRFRGEAIRREGDAIVADAGAELQSVVDFSVAEGLQGLETLAGIPGSLGAAVYGNAGAYGHSMSERVTKVTFFDGEAVRTFGSRDCEFQYRESVFKRHKDWIVFFAELSMTPADPTELRRIAEDIMAVRNEKFPPTMKCAGSVFKNLIFAELPESVARAVPQSSVREGKVPAAFFLDQAGAKGLSRGDIHVAAYHANLIYNGGAGTARDLRDLIADVKSRVHAKFGLTLEEEVQYVGF